MSQVINAKTLRRELGRILERVRRGERFTVLYRSQPVCELVPPGEGIPPDDDLENDPIYRMPALGRSTDDGLSSKDHDAILYGDP